jgi:hypothetical protein
VSRFRWILLLALVGGATPLAVAQTSPAGDVIADFEAADLGAITADRATATLETDRAPQGQRYLSVKSDAATGSSIQLQLVDPKLFVARDHLRAMLRAPESGKPLTLRWLARDQSGATILQRRFEVPPGNAWVQLNEPLDAWRWGDRQAGDWDDVRSLALRIESPNVRVDVDDVRVEGALDLRERIERTLELAFEKDKRIAASAGELVVATNAVDGFKEADLQRLLGDMQSIRAMLRRVFAESVRPIDDTGPACLLIFQTSEQQNGFLSRLSRQWRATIAPSTSQGYTVQDLSCSTYRADLGVRRPVYLHEATHALVARDLRLLTGNDAHTPLQEGLASYVQLCVFPQSLDPKTYPTNFGKPIDPAGNGFFKPLELLFSRRATTEDYAQLASLIAYLIDSDPALLRALAAGMSNGTSAADVLRQSNTSWRVLQDGWFSWGRRRFVETPQPAETAPFERFPEMK